VISEISKKIGKFTRKMMDGKEELGTWNISALELLLLQLMHEIKY